MFNLEAFAQKLDVQIGIPRPANEQHLTSFKAFMRWCKDIFTTVLFTLFALAAGALWVDVVIQLFQFELIKDYSAFGLIGAVGLMVVLMALLLDASSIWLAYRKEFQSDTFGSARWADLNHLKEKNLLYPLEDGLENAVMITRFQRKWKIALPLPVFAQHCGVFAPPGAGKTSTIVMNVVRDFARFGGAAILDPKGEIYQYTAHYFSKVARFDMNEPEFTDFFSLFGPCRNDSVLAGKVAHILISSGTPQKDPIWEQSATAMLKNLILHLCEILPYPTPTSVFNFLAKYPAKAQKRIGENGKEEYFYPLHEQLENSPNEDVRRDWKANFSQLSKDTFTSVIFTLLSRLDVFNDPKVRTALRPPTPDEIKAGRKIIDFSELRKIYECDDGTRRGTAIYCVIPLGESERLKNVIACFFAIAAEVLRNTGEKDEKGNEQKVYSLLMLDEIGNIPIPGLQEIINMGRGLKMCTFVSYQNKSQPEIHYGAPAAKAILESLGTTIFLPGVKGENADYAVRLLQKTTVHQKSSSDSVNNNYDSAKLTETGRDLMDAAEFRQMPWFTQMVIVSNDVNAIRARFPDDAKKLDARICEPRSKTARNAAEKVGLKTALPPKQEELTPEQAAAKIKAERKEAKRFDNPDKDLDSNLDNGENRHDAGLKAIQNFTNLRAGIGDGEEEGEAPPSQTPQTVFENDSNPPVDDIRDDSQSVRTAEENGGLFLDSINHDNPLAEEEEYVSISK